MKARASFTFDKETVDIIDRLIKEKGYRNKSHVVERAIQILGEKEIIEKQIEQKEVNERPLARRRR